MLTINKEWKGTLSRGDDIRQVLIRRATLKTFRVSVELKKGGYTGELLTRSEMYDKFSRFRDWSLLMEKGFYKALPEMEPFITPEVPGSKAPESKPVKRKGD